MLFRVATILALHLTLWSPVQRALACQCNDGYLTWTLPADGDEAVPTNVVLWANAGGAATWRLRTDAGDVVPMRAELVHPSHACDTGQWRITPDQLLQAHTRYALQARWKDPPERYEITFTTGPGPLAHAKLAAPRGVQVALMAPKGECCVCGREHATALCHRGGQIDEAAEDDVMLELTVHDPTIPPSALEELQETVARLDEELDVEQPPLSELATFDYPPHEEVRALLVPGDIYLHPYAVPRCIELRTRATDGSRSDAVRLCDEDLPMVAHSDEIWDCEALFEAVAKGDLVRPPRIPEQEDAGSEGSGQNAQASDERTAATRAGSDSKRDARADEGGKTKAASHTPSRGCRAAAERPVPWFSLLSGIGLLLHARRHRQLG